MSTSPKRKVFLLRKLTALFVLLSFTLCETVVYAEPVSPSWRGSVPGKAKAISIPEEFGKIEESFTSTSGKTIIYIQDAHDSLEAQENIAKIIQYLVDKHGVNTVL